MFRLTVKHLYISDGRMYIDQTECLENTQPLPQQTGSGKMILEIRVQSFRLLT